MSKHTLHSQILVISLLVVAALPISASGLDLPLIGPSGETILGLGTVAVSAYSPDGNYFVTAGSLGVFLWDSETGTLLHAFCDYTNSVNSFTFSPDCNRILTGSAGSTAKLWDIETGQEIHTFHDQTNEVVVGVFTGRDASPCV